MAGIALLFEELFMGEDPIVSIRYLWKRRSQRWVKVSMNNAYARTYLDRAATVALAKLLSASTSSSIITALVALFSRDIVSIISFQL